MKKLRAILNIIRNRPTIYGVIFDGSPVVRISKNYGIDISRVTNLTVDMEGTKVSVVDFLKLSRISKESNTEKGREGRS